MTAIRFEACSSAGESNRSFWENPIARKRIRYDKEAYKKRNVIERCFCRLKDFMRIATRYDKLARNISSAVCLVAVWPTGFNLIESQP
jgi:transposase